MKKILVTLLAAFISWTAFAQVAGDKLTIHKTNGDTVSYYFTGSSNVLSSISSCIYNLNNQIYKFNIFFHHSFGFGHMTGIPLKIHLFFLIS